MAVVPPHHLKILAAGGVLEIFTFILNRLAIGWRQDSVSCSELRNWSYLGWSFPVRYTSNHAYGHLVTTFLFAVKSSSSRHSSSSKSKSNNNNKKKKHRRRCDLSSIKSHPWTDECECLQQMQMHVNTGRSWRAMVSRCCDGSVLERQHILSDDNLGRCIYKPW